MKERATQAARAAAFSVLTRVAILRQQIPMVRDQDVEGVHDMRVASRRLRAALGEYKPLFTAPARKAFHGRIQEVTRLLGRPRELDVHLHILEQFRLEENGVSVGALHYVIEHIRGDRLAQSKKCVKAVELVASEDLDGELAALLTSVRRNASGFLDAIGNRLESRYMQLCECYDTWEALETREQLHEVRIAFKKVRYACEIFLPFYESDMKGFIKQLKQVQEHLGSWNDARVLSDELAAIAEGAPKDTSDGIQELRNLFEDYMHVYLAQFHGMAVDFFTPESRASVTAFLREVSEI
jgi:CHAD domain-containing protein